MAVMFGNVVELQFFLIEITTFWTNNSYCKWRNFPGVAIFVLFIDGPIDEYQYPPTSDFIYEL